MKKNPLYNTSSISFFQYLFAIAVIMVHSGRLTSYEPVHFGLKSILGRMAVPFFIVCASFFLKQSLRDARKMKTRKKDPGIRKVNKTPKQIGFYDFDQIGLYFLRIP